MKHYLNLGLGAAVFLSGTSKLRAQESTPATAPDQAHVMVDIGHQFGDLWFAAQKQNWPLAQFYLDQTRSHLKWAVKIQPVRKTSAGADVDLNGILQINGRWGGAVS